MSGVAGTQRAGLVGNISVSSLREVYGDLTDRKKRNLGAPPFPSARPFPGHSPIPRRWIVSGSRANPPVFIRLYRHMFMGRKDDSPNPGNYLAGSTRPETPAPAGVFALPCFAVSAGNAAAHPPHSPAGYPARKRNVPAPPLRIQSLTARQAACVFRRRDQARWNQTQSDIMRR